MKQKIFNASLRNGGKSDHWLASFALLGMILLEWDLKPTISPLVCMLCFGFFAHRMRPNAVMGWVTIYTSVALIFLLQPWAPITGLDRTTAYIRFGTLLLGGTGAVVLSLQRIRVSEAFLQTLTILEKLPAPVVLSDCAGDIVFMNEDALHLLGTTVKEAIGASYFTFLADTGKGQSIQRYLDIVDSGQDKVGEVIVQLKKPSPKKAKATLVGVQINNTRLLATVLRVTPDTEKEA